MGENLSEPSAGCCSLVLSSGWGDPALPVQLVPLEFKKNMNASKSSEHPPQVYHRRGGMKFHMTQFF